MCRHSRLKCLVAGIALFALVAGAAYSAPSISGQTTVPDTPAGLTGMLQADESVELDWEDSSNAASYQVAYRHAHASVWVDLPAAGAILTVTGSGAAVIGLPYPLNYYFRVRASNAVGTSDWSAESLVTPAPIVGADGCVIAAPPDHLSQYDKHCLRRRDSHRRVRRSVRLRHQAGMEPHHEHAFGPPWGPRQDGPSKGASRLEGRRHIRLL